MIQVYLGSDGHVQVYANATIQPGSPINSDLLLDQSEANIYVMTRNTVCILKTNTLLLNVSKYDSKNHVVFTKCVAATLFSEASKAAFPFKALAQTSPRWG